jgi:hypothetical protein
MNSEYSEEPTNADAIQDYLAKHPHATNDEALEAIRTQLEIERFTNALRLHFWRPKVRSVEVLSLTAETLDTGTKIVAITIRPDPLNSPRSVVLAISKDQAQRIRDDLDSILNAEDIAWR